MRVVLDTNVFISAILGGKLSVFLDEWRAGQFTLLVSEAIIREYFDVINRPKFRFTAAEITIIRDYLLRTAEFVTPTQTVTAVEADPSDNKFLEAALAGRAICVVSGDKHLLNIGSFQDIEILTAYDFIVLLEALR